MPCCPGGPRPPVCLPPRCRPLPLILPLTDGMCPPQPFVPRGARRTQPPAERCCVNPQKTICSVKGAPLGFWRPSARGIQLTAAPPPAAPGADANAGPGPARKTLFTANLVASAACGRRAAHARRGRALAWPLTALRSLQPRPTAGGGQRMPATPPCTQDRPW
ncbi:MAG: hypothetical protein J3K34DRAFT_404422 [Monoraphidium minutum]|nr:MAG: hypothetical protein J3K34DRAFT_404422 [Monoraphidium minutum]